MDRANAKTVQLTISGGCRVSQTRSDSITRVVVRMFATYQSIHFGEMTEEEQEEEEDNRIMYACSIKFHVACTTTPTRPIVIQLGSQSPSSSHPSSAVDKFQFRIIETCQRSLSGAIS